MSSTFSHFTILNLVKIISGSLIAPGIEHYPNNSSGFVRSEVRAKLSKKNYTSDSLPVRDYPVDVLTNEAKLAKSLASHTRSKMILLSARNVLNEYGHYIRTREKIWYGRAYDPPIDLTWPVICVDNDKAVSIQALLNVNDQEVDILTGVPLVINNKAMSRNFLIAHSSDPSHAYRVHPQGLLGSSREAWLALTNSWEKSKQLGRSDKELVQRMDALAKKYTVEPNKNLLHSIIGQKPDKSLVCVAITASLPDIAKLLVGMGLCDAILLDNGGSVGWRYCSAKGKDPVLILAGPNHRESGSAFLALEIKDFLHPCSHYIVNK